MLALIWLDHLRLTYHFEGHARRLTDVFGNVVRELSSDQKHQDNRFYIGDFFRRAIWGFADFGSERFDAPCRTRRCSTVVADYQPTC